MCVSVFIEITYVRGFFIMTPDMQLRFSATVEQNEGLCEGLFFNLKPKLFLAKKRKSLTTINYNVMDILNRLGEEWQMSKSGKLLRKHSALEREQTKMSIMNKKLSGQYDGVAGTFS